VNSRATTIVHAVGRTAGGALSPSLEQSSVYAATSIEHAVALEKMVGGRSSYSRVANPTVHAFEQAMAEIEGGERALATPSGMAALSLVFLTLLDGGDRVVASPHSYTDTLVLLQELSQKIGFELHLTDLGAPGAPEEVMRLRPTLVVLESPSNPMLRVADIRGIVQGLRTTGGRLVVDNTMATPVNQLPLSLGADLVVHSASKYISGHYNTIAGVVVGAEELITRMHHVRTVSGLCLDPHAAWLLLHGMQTLHVRVSAQNAAALAVAEYLASRTDIEFVCYPGIATSPDHGVAATQMTGFGGVLTFGPRLDDRGLVRFLDAVELCTLAVSLGGTRTLIESPALMSHAQGGSDHESLAFVPANAVRLSVGLEDPDDIMDDLQRALDKAHAQESG
jgi:cystathionine beta-lyase/cystathionine gamma-synthase